MKRQPRAKTMLPAIKELIARRSLEDRDVDRNPLALDLIDEIIEKYPNEIPPTKATVIKKISEARSHPTDPLDEAWHLGTLDKYPLDPEVIPIILKIKKLETIYKVSIRQAKWINKLHHVVTDIKLLSDISRHYTFNEKISIISKSEPFDTSEYDSFLFNQKQQKQLVEKFHSLQRDVEWTLRRKIHKQVTDISLGEEIFGYEFKGDEVSVLTTQGNRHKIATRAIFIDKHLSTIEISDPSELPEGDFVLKPKIRTFYHDREDD